MTSENSESENPFEKLSPAERQQALWNELLKLPRQLIEGEPQIIENIAYLNRLSKLLEYSVATKSLTRNTLRDVAYACEFGVEALKIKPDGEDFPSDALPLLLLEDAGETGIFGYEDRQHIDQRALLSLGVRRGANRGTATDHNLFVEWSVEYQNLYHQNPHEDISPLEMSGGDRGPGNLF